MSDKERLRPSEAQFLQIATTKEMPAWATHVAVRYDGSKVEPALWSAEYNDFLDEDPGTRKSGWIGGFKKAYWRFFTIEEVNAARHL